MSGRSDTNRINTTLLSYSFPGRLGLRNWRGMSIGSRLAGLVLLAASVSARPDAAASAPPVELRRLTLDECLDHALQQNRRRPASQFAVAAAEAQLAQVLSSYWPQVNLRAGVERLEEAPNFIFPSAAIPVPSQSFNTPPTTALVTIPAGILGPDAIQLPVSVPAQSVTTTPSGVVVPEQNVRLAHRDTGFAGVETQWLLFDGGLRKGLRRQAEGAVVVMQQDARRTDLEIAETVRRIYHGAVLAAQLRVLGDDTLEQMEVTLLVTEQQYREGAGDIGKTDYLNNRIVVESLRAMTHTLHKHERLAQAALANAVGLPWQESVVPADTTIALHTDVPTATAVMDTAFVFNPDWIQLEAGLEALEGAVRAERSGSAPRIAVTGTLHQIWNHHDMGLMSAENKTGWSVGLGLELPLFDGFANRHAVAAARARLAQLKAQRVLLREGLGLQVRAVLLELDAAVQADGATFSARQAAEESRDLTTRAYETGLAETDEVIRAQLVEALMTAQHLKARYEQAIWRGRLALLVGQELSRQLSTSR